MMKLESARQVTNRIMPLLAGLSGIKPGRRV
jgi:hypothetical protein